MRISATPSDALLDQPIVFTVADLAPGTRVRLSLRQHTLRAEAHAEFVASAEGLANVALDAPAVGDYEGTDAAGLFWSARFDAGADVVSMVDALSRLEPLAYTLTATAADGRAAAVDFTCRLVAPNVVRTPVRDGRIRGTLFAPKDATNLPGVIVLGGSDGGNLWAFVAALLVGASFRDVAAIVALVPSGVTVGGIGSDPSAMAGPAWTLNGVPFQVFPPPGDVLTMQEAQAAFAGGPPFAGTPSFLRALERAGAGIDHFAIPVERTGGAIFIMSGEDDKLWPSTRLAAVAEDRLKAVAFPYPFEHRRYPAAGHFACLPPNLPATSTAGRHPVVPMSLAFGGTARGNAAASADLWPRILTFLHRHLAA